VLNSINGALLIDTLVAYDVATSGPITAGASLPQAQTIRIPDGSASVGDLQITITADSADAIFEYNGTGNAEANNSAMASATAI
jgi:hypothetical protein